MLKVALAACVGAVLLSGAGISSAAVMQLVNFASEPLTPPATAQPEFVYQPAAASHLIPSFYEGAGSVGNGDGNLPLASQSAQGLETTTTHTSATLQTDPGAVSSGMGTTLYDTSMYIYGQAPIPPAPLAGYTTAYGLVANGPAQQTVLPGPTVIDSQALFGGAFSIYSTAAPTQPGNNTLPVPAYGTSTLSNGSVLLLSGIISYGAIEGVDGSTAGATFSAMGITYTGGDIYNALVADYGPNAVLSGNDLSISLTGVSPPFSIAPGTYGTGPGDGQLSPFSAEATGLTDVTIVPEPASASLLLVAGAGLLIRWRARRA